MKDRIKVYVVRKRVDKHENGWKGCYFLSCLYRIKSCLYVRLAKPNGPNSGPKYVWSTHGPWKESGFVFIQILVISVWTFLRVIFEKINRIKTERPGKKAKFYREQSSQCSSALLFCWEVLKQVWGMGKDQQWACPFHRWTGLGSWCSQSRHSTYCLPISSSAQQTTAVRCDTSWQGQLESLHSLSGQTRWDYTESILLQQSSAVFQAKTIWDVWAQRKHLQPNYTPQKINELSFWKETVPGSLLFAPQS